MTAKIRNMYLRTSYVNVALGADGDDIGHEEQNEDNEGRGDSGGNDKNDALQEHMRQVSRSKYLQFEFEYDCYLLAGDHYCLT